MNPYNLLCSIVIISILHGRRDKGIEEVSDLPRVRQLVSDLELEAREPDSGLYLCVEAPTGLPVPLEEDEVTYWKGPDN